MTVICVIYRNGTTVGVPVNCSPHMNKISKSARHIKISTHEQSVFIVHNNVHFFVSPRWLALLALIRITTWNGRLGFCHFEFPSHSWARAHRSSPFIVLYYDHRCDHTADHGHTDIRYQCITATCFIHKSHRCVDGRLFDVRVWCAARICARQLCITLWLVLSMLLSSTRTHALCFSFFCLVNLRSEYLVWRNGVHQYSHILYTLILWKSLTNLQFIFIFALCLWYLLCFGALAQVDRAADIQRENLKKKRRELEQASMDAASDLLDTDSNATFAMVVHHFGIQMFLFLFFFWQNEKCVCFFLLFRRSHWCVIRAIRWQWRNYVNVRCIWRRQSGKAVAASGWRNSQPGKRLIFASVVTHTHTRCVIHDKTFMDAIHEQWNGMP